VLLSFEQQNIRLGNAWLFSNRQVMRFEWLALLALKRISVPADQAWVTLEDIGRLPLWAGKMKHHIRTNIGRYLGAPELTRRHLVDTPSRWTGPYRFVAGPLLIEFDIPVTEVKKRLRVRDGRTATSRKKLLRFTASYTRSQYLLFQGRLLASENGDDLRQLYGR